MAETVVVVEAAAPEVAEEAQTHSPGAGDMADPGIADRPEKSPHSVAALADHRCRRPAADALRSEVRPDHPAEAGAAVLQARVPHLRSCPASEAPWPRWRSPLCSACHLCPCRAQRKSVRPSDASRAGLPAAQVEAARAEPVLQEPPAAVGVSEHPARPAEPQPKHRAVKTESFSWINDVRVKVMRASGCAPDTAHDSSHHRKFLMNREPEICERRVKS